jgi:hypothetical protein
MPPGLSANCMEIDLKEESHDSQAVLANVAWLDRLVWSAIILSAGVLAASFAGFQELNWTNIHIRFTQAWILFVLLTIGHLYVTILTCVSISRLFHQATAPDRARVFRQVAATGGLLVRGLLPRVTRRRLAGGVYLYPMSVSDPSSWAAGLVAILMLVACARSGIGGSGRLVSWLWGAACAACNWLIASYWIIGLSELVLTDPEQRLLARVGEAAAIPAPFPFIGSTSGIAWSRRPLLVALLFYLVTAVALLAVTVLTGLVALPMLLTAIRKWFRRGEVRRRISRHDIVGGCCRRCGCPVGAIEHFGWPCETRYSTSATPADEAHLEK